MAFDFVFLVPRVSLMLLYIFTLLAYFVLLDVNFSGRFALLVKKEKSFYFMMT